MAKKFSEDAYCLGLQLKDGNICKRNNYHIGIVSAPTFMNQFIKKLKSGELKIETCPQVEVDSELTEEYIIKQLESYPKLLESEVIKKATNKLYLPLDLYAGIEVIFNTCSFLFLIKFA